MLLWWCNERIQGTEEFQWVYNSRPGMPPLFVVLGNFEEIVQAKQDQEENQIQNEGNGKKKTDSTLSYKKEDPKERKRPWR